SPALRDSSSTPDSPSFASIASKALWVVTPKRPWRKQAHANSRSLRLLTLSARNFSSSVGLSLASHCSSVMPAPRGLFLLPRELVPRHLHLDGVQRRPRRDVQRP